MTLVIGLDTGGTFTDAAIIKSESGELVSKAKSPTTREDLSVGLGLAITAALDKIPSGKRNEVRRSGLSTTLATNAVVEGFGNCRRTRCQERRWSYTACSAP